MIIQKTLDTSTHSPEDTYCLGKQIGSILTTGLVICLIGELGSGKTTFVQGLAKGLEVPEKYHITSPTYTLINEYPARHPLFHVDLYRLKDSDAFEDIGLYDILDDGGVVAIEWAQKFTEINESEHIDISFKFLSETSRGIHLAAYGNKAVALLQAISK